MRLRGTCRPSSPRASSRAAARVAEPHSGSRVGSPASIATPKDLRTADAPGGRRERPRPPRKRAASAPREERVGCARTMLLDRVKPLRCGSKEGLRVAVSGLLLRPGWLARKSRSSTWCRRRGEAKRAREAFRFDGKRPSRSETDLSLHRSWSRVLKIRKPNCSSRSRTTTDVVAVLFPPAREVLGSPGPRARVQALGRSSWRLPAPSPSPTPRSKRSSRRSSRV